MNDNCQVIERKKSYKGGCGCVLVIVGTLMILTALFFAFVLYSADEEAGVKNEAEWAAYSKQMEAIDSIQDVQVRDSLMADLEQQAPLIRQGGFATLFGIVIGGAVVLVALIPLIIGTVLLVKHRRAKRKAMIEP